MLPVEEQVGRAHDDRGGRVEDEGPVRRQRFVYVVLEEVAVVHVEARLGPEHLAAWVAEVGHAESPLWSHRADTAVSPASLMKLATTSAALELLGPGYTWRTGVTYGGPVRDGVLEGSLYLRGEGDPLLVNERLWLLLSRVRDEGVREIRGDIVLDRSAFDVAPEDPGAFDGEPLRPYNVQPDALLINFRRNLKSLFIPKFQITMGE